MLMQFMASNSRNDLWCLEAKLAGSKSSPLYSGEKDRITRICVIYKENEIL